MQRAPASRKSSESLEDVAPVEGKLVQEQHSVVPQSCGTLLEAARPPGQPVEGKRPAHTARALSYS
jgi:hypothetical protein